MNKEQKAAHKKKIDQDWTASVASISTEELKALLNELSRSPSMILETQHRLMAIGLSAFTNGNLQASELLRNTGLLLSNFAVSAKEYHEANGGDV